ncbi:hypothetical protein SAMN06265222_1258 [Neorhodopirellula lusitana]|uniref:Uncharacterized protein n=1 Tax=Neorhodopirellula lusitana TaxID=445327 RepID=A0ABY1QRJ3_9BACT|nr:hypothetical protein SAMN06265222_1258 [Neorhodopirellula lusitana]
MIRLRTLVGVSACLLFALYLARTADVSEVATVHRDLRVNKLNPASLESRLEAMRPGDPEQFAIELLGDCVCRDFGIFREYTTEMQGMFRLVRVCTLDGKVASIVVTAEYGPQTLFDEVPRDIRIAVAWVGIYRKILEDHQCGDAIPLMGVQGVYDTLELPVDVLECG